MNRKTHADRLSGHARTARKAAASILLAAVLALMQTCFVFAGSGRFVLNTSGLFPGELAGEEEYLYVRGVPMSSEYRQLYLCLYGEDGQRAFSQVAPRDESGEARFSFRLLDAGEYAVSLLHSRERYSGYSTLLHKDVRLSWDGENISFLDAPAAAYNAGEEKLQADPEMLAFFLRPSATMQSNAPEIAALAASITEGLSGDAEKARAVHDWVCSNIYYDYDLYCLRTPYEGSSALKVYRDRRSVCAGYANLTVALLRAAGIPARKIGGCTPDASRQDWPQEFYDGTLSESNHAWCEAYIDDHWAIIDTTWDSNNAYEFGRITCSDGIDDYRYFDISRELFSADHAALRGHDYGTLMLYVGYPRLWNAREQEWKEIDSYGTAPVIRNGRTMIPIASVVEEMGGTVEWTPGSAREYPKITCRLSGHVATVWIGYNVFYVDGIKYAFDVTPQIINGRSMVPFSALLEAMDCEVQWDAHADNWDGRITLRYAN